MKLLAQLAEEQTSAKPWVGPAQRVEQVLSTVGAASICYLRTSDAGTNVPSNGDAVDYSAVAAEHESLVATHHAARVCA